MDDDLPKGAKKRDAVVLEAFGATDVRLVGGLEANHGDHPRGKYVSLFVGDYGLIWNKKCLKAHKPPAQQA
jgi:hypothetical protein